LKIKEIFILISALLSILFLLSRSHAIPINIKADHLEYLSKENIYIARGSVVITTGEIKLRADEIRLNATTGEAILTGNIQYEDPDVIITGNRVEMNIKTRLGRIYNSHVFYKKESLYIAGDDIEKTGERSFFLNRASLTSCESTPPAWRISGKNIKVTQQKSIRGWHGTFYVKNIPLLYTPYFWVPVGSKRKSGLLFPSLGYSSERGHVYKQGLFWAIRDNQDATFYLDYYTEKGLAQGIDYRYILSPDTNGEFWFYHARDNEPKRDLVEFKSYHNFSISEKFSGYLKLHLVNEYDYYKVMDSTSSGRFGLESWEIDPFGFASPERLQKYLESSLHIIRPVSNGRVYLLTQGRQSLEGSSEGIPQYFPEIAFFLNTQTKRHISFDFGIRSSYLWREEGSTGLRIDLNPNLYLSTGRAITLTQRIGIRNTSYFLGHPSLNKNRFTTELNTTLSTRFYKRYEKFIHVIEPAIEYSYIPPVDNDNIPLFDSIDSISHTSSISYSFTNRISGLNDYNLEARFRISQSYSLLKNIDKEFSPLLTEATLTSKNISLNLNSSYDVHDGRFTETIASIRYRDKIGYIGAGKNFRRITSLDQYTFDAGLNHPIRIFDYSLPIDVQTRLWYDVKGAGVQEFNITMKYFHQCWSFSVSYRRLPKEYEILLRIEFLGLGSINIGRI